MKKAIRNTIMLLSCGLLCLTDAAAQLHDQSDSVFSIVIPSAEARDIDMGTVLVGETRDSLVNGFVRNTGRAAIRIDEAVLNSGTTGHFAITGGLPPVTVHEGEEHAMAFSFSPLAAGPLEAEIFIVTQVDTQRYRIHGVGVVPQIEVATRYVDFGVVPVGAERDTLVDVMLRNLTAGPVQVSGIRLSGPDTLQFSMIGGAQPMTLPPFASHAMELRFAPRRGGRSSGSITFEIEGGLDRPVALLFGEGTAVEGSATLTTDTLRAAAGEVITVPIRLRDAVNLQLSGATHLVAQLRFRAASLVPTGATPMGWLEDTWRIIPLDDLPRLPLRDDIIAEYTFMTVLGTEESTPLILQNSASVGADVSLLEIPGYFILEDICREGGTRLFDGERRVSLRQNTPNPFNSSTTISFDVLERGVVRLSIMNLEGRVLRTAFEGYVEPGSYTVRFDADALPSGIYLYELRSGNSLLQRRMQLLK
ncbi:MAG: hypothetical protein C0600_06370 [Ignavibacteria bacterium]|nr:MAG: hypothetical protein C0600_06370 [Ignavibacteria bacterium]